MIEAKRLRAAPVPPPSPDRTTVPQSPQSWCLCGLNAQWPWLPTAMSRSVKTLTRNNKVAQGFISDA